MDIYKKHNDVVPHNKGFVHAEPCYNPVNEIGLIKEFCQGVNRRTYLLGSPHSVLSLNDACIRERVNKNIKDKNRKPLSKNREFAVIQN